MGATIIAAIHGSPANRAGSFFERTKCVRPGRQMPVGDKKRVARGYVCQEADQHLQNAKKNTHGSRDKRTRQSAGNNESKKSLWKAAWMRWLNSGNTLQHRRRYSTLVSIKRKLRSSRVPLATSASDSCLQICRDQCLGDKFSKRNVGA